MNSQPAGTQARDRGIERKTTGRNRDHEGLEQRMVGLVGRKGG